MRSALAFLVFSVVAIAGASCAKPHRSDPTVTAFDFNVLDMDREIEFLRLVDVAPRTDVPLGDASFARLFGVPEARARQVTTSLGEQTLVLTRFDVPAPAMPSIARADDPAFQHIAIVVRDMQAAHARLVAARVAFVSPGPQTIPWSNPAAGGVQAEYFRDPEGHFLELIAFPPEKGDAAWHRPSDRLFLGIDHTALVVRDTAASLAFYRDAVGMRIAAESLNEGPAQEALSGVPGARVRITSLRGPSGPGVELLEYTNRPRDRASAGVDRTHWAVAIELTNLDDALRRVHSSAVAPVETATFGSERARAVLAHDPDGHGVLLTERKKAGGR